MVEGNGVIFRSFDGPSLFAPFAAVIVEFTSHFDNPLAAAVIERSFYDLLTGDMRPVLKLPPGDVTLPELVGPIANAWQDMPGENHLPVEIRSLGCQQWRVALGFLNADMAVEALKAGLEFANAIFASAAQTAADLKRLRGLAERVTLLAHRHQPRRISRLMISQAARRGVPVHAYAPGSHIWVHGLGARSHRFYEAITSEQSELGARLAKDKVHAKRFLARLGFPIAPYGMADNLPMALEIAAKIGYPVVTKPPDREKAAGVTTDIYNAAELKPGFDLAKRKSRGGLVLIERHMRGENFRLSIFGGRVKRNAQHSAATIIGDGRSTVAELIAAENARRTPAEIAAGVVRGKLKIDPAMVAILAKQGYVLDDRLPATQSLVLGTSNLNDGGRHSDVTADTHPDTIAMAEAVARCFGLDATGIDFITPDITRSWREVVCAINEVNVPPGISDHALAESAFTEKFPHGSDGLIDCVLVVSDRDEIGLAVMERLKAKGTRVGFAGNEATSLDGERRFVRGGDLPTRIWSLVFDPACDALVVTCSARDIENHGLPYARFRVALLGDAEGLTPELRALLADHVPHCLEVPQAADVADIADAAIAALHQ